MQYRHGDVLIEPIGQIPKRKKKLQHSTLAFGEITGHSHRIKETDAVVLFESSGILFIDVVNEFATVIHEEHDPIKLPKGFYRVWRQREYTPEEIRVIRD